MPIAPPTDGPPPSPALDPAAARETGQPMPNTQGIQGLASPMSLQPQGPDLSVVNKMFQAVKEALLLLAQAVPAQAAGLQNIISLVDTEAKTFGNTNGSTPGATGQVTTQAGAQFPGGGISQGKSF